uniref:Uncharacterized protein n=1 Tax=Labrus bergylta TaxID=56723 RepID=A0A3Q3FE44_9LABR
MFGPADLKLCGVKTLAVIICFISLGNVLLQISTFIWWRQSGPACSAARSYLSSSAWSWSFGSAAAPSASGLSPASPRVLNAALCVTLLTSCLMFTLSSSSTSKAKLCFQTSSSRSAESYLLVCRLTVALVWVYLATLLTISLFYLHAVFASGLSADMLFLGLSFYCVASAILLSCSNQKPEREPALFCQGKMLGGNRYKKINPP